MLELARESLQCVMDEMDAFDIDDLPCTLDIIDSWKDVLQSAQDLIAKGLDVQSRLAVHTAVPPPSAPPCS